MTLRFEWIKIS